jgi:hypothetical protein
MHAYVHNIDSDVATSLTYLFETEAHKNSLFQVLLVGLRLPNIVAMREVETDYRQANGYQPDASGKPVW